MNPSLGLGGGCPAADAPPRGGHAKTFNPDIESVRRINKRHQRVTIASCYRVPKKLKEYAATEATAKEEGRGLWAWDAKSVKPWEWRRGKRFEELRQR